MAQKKKQHEYVKTSPPFWTRPWIFLALMTVVAFVAFFPELRGEFVFDDWRYIQFNPKLNRLTDLLSWQTFWTRRPLYWFLFFIERKLWGANPLGFKIVSLLFHIGAAFFLMKFITSACKIKDLSYPWLPHLSALAFLLSPLTTEAVSYISGRNNSAGGMLFILGAWLFLNWFQTRTQKAAFKTFALSVLCFVAAFLFKEIYIVFLVFCPALYWWLTLGTEHQVDTRRIITAGAIILVVFGILIAFAPYQPLEHVRNALIRTFTTGNSRALATNTHSILYSLRLFAYPDRLNIDHDLPILDSFRDPLAWGALVVLSLIAAALFLLRRKLPLGLPTYFMYLLLILPSNSFILRKGEWVIDPISERNLYACAMFFSIFLVHFLTEVIRDKRYQIVCIALLIVGFGVRTHFRSRDYATNLSLWGSAVKYSPNRPRAHNNLANELASSGKLSEALKHAEFIMDQSPERVEGYLLAGNLNKRMGKPNKAIREFRRGIQSANGDLTMLWFQLGQLYYEQGQYDRSKHALQSALTLDPHYLSPRLTLLYILLQEGHMNETTRHINELNQHLERVSTQMSPREAINDNLLAMYHFARGWFLLENQDLSGIGELETAIEYNPQMIEPYLKLGDYYYRQGAYALSIDYFAKAARLPQASKYQQQMQPYLENLQKLMRNPTLDPAIQ